MPRIRRWIWRHRHLLAAVVVAVAGWTVVSELRPAPPASEAVLALSRDLPAGSLLSGQDVEVVEVAAALAPRAALRDPGEAVGGRLAVGLPAGLPLTAHVLAGSGLAAGVPPGSVVVPVRLADDGVASLLEPGDRIDLLGAVADAAGSSGPAQVVAAGALVVARDDAAPGGLLGTESSPVLVLVALPRSTAANVVGANAWAPLRVVIPPPGEHAR